MTLKTMIVLALFFLNQFAFGQTGSIQTHYPNYWSSDREYTYRGFYIDSLGLTITSEKIILQPTGQKWEIDQRQTLMDYTLDSISADWNKLPKVPLNGKKRNWFTSTYQEGVLQTPNKIWMHPIRQNQYILTEVAPFPQVILPIKQDTSWKDTLYIYATMGIFVGTVESNYSINAMELRTYEFGNLLCWKIIATGFHDKLGMNSAIFYFNPEFGFTEMNYVFYNQQKIEFKLTALKK